MKEVKVAWPTAKREAWPPQGFSPIVMACGRFDFAASGQPGFGYVRVYLHGDIILHT